jgi:hypothetical protein
VDVLVAPAAGEQPATAADLVRERVDRGVRGALPPADLAPPYVPIGSAIRLSVAILSYVDTVSFGVTADAAFSADLDVFTAGIQRGLAELSGRAAR